MACPKCGNTDWKLASLVHAEGKRIVLTSSVGVGTAVGSGGGPVLAAGRTSGIEQSVLSKVLEPPTMPTEDIHPALGCALALVGLPVLLYIGAILAKQPQIQQYALLGTVVGGLLALPFLGFAALTPSIDKKLKAQHENAMQEYRKALDEYNRKKVCMRCGEVYLDDNQTQATVPAAEPQPFAVASESAAPEPQPTKKCPFCAETVLADAVLCKHCKSKLA